MGELLREFLHEITGDPTRYLAELVQSLLLLGILGWAGRRSLRQRLDARRTRIVAELTEAEQAERDGSRLEEEARSRAARGREEAPALLHQAEADAEKERKAALDRIEAEAMELVAQARQAVEGDKVRVAREAAGRLVELTAEAARRYLDEMLTEAERRALTQKAILASLGELSGSPSPGGGAA
jgi:F0F1-type ATP synthase membrane subunit b/b'